jgi:hypothetical protein
MKWARGALLGALALAACGRGGGGAGTGAVATSKPAADPAAAPDPVTVTSPASSPGDCPDGVAIRMIGTAPQGVSLSLVPGIVGASCAPAAPVCGTRDVASEPGDLSSDAHAWTLGFFNLPPAGFPPDGAPMTLLVTFSGGTATADGVTGPLSLCGASISIPFDPHRVSRDRCSVTILLDVRRSVVRTAGGLLFVPQYRVFF